MKNLRKIGFLEFAHDIKTPLSVIVSNTSLAIEKTDNDLLLKNLKPTLVESHYIQNLLNDLNIFARLTMVI